MRHLTAVHALAAAVVLAIPGTALAQAQPPMAEVFNLPVQVTTNNVTNTLYFNPNGTVQIMTPGGSAVSGNWAIQGNNLCLSMANGASECWAYRAFQAQQPQTVTSSCNSVTTWLAQNVNSGQTQPKGERGR